jgi:2-keto-4-pentenoate hydratase/2-oxohepta-3-ene-1,7-dioic acid hydratase in catechol pathway
LARLLGEIGAGSEMGGDAVTADGFLAPLPPDAKVVVMGGRVPLKEAGRPKDGACITGHAKFPTAFADPGAPISLPRDGGTFDADAVLGLVIGPKASVLGYTLLLDVTDRARAAAEAETNNGLMAKNRRRLSPMGPCIWIPDAAPRPGKIEVTLRVNGTLRQLFTLADMVFGVDDVIAAWSPSVLRPGDVLGFGGAIADPHEAIALQTPVRIQPGDIIELSAEAIGGLRAEVE